RKGVDDRYVAVRKRTPQAPVVKHFFDLWLALAARRRAKHKAAFDEEVRVVRHCANSPEPVRLALDEGRRIAPVDGRQIEELIAFEQRRRILTLPALDKVLDRTF